MKDLMEVLQQPNIPIKVFFKPPISFKRGMVETVYLANRPVLGVSITVEDIVDLGNFGVVRCIYLANSLPIGYSVNSILNVTKLNPSYLFVGKVEYEINDIKVDVLYSNSDIQILRNTRLESYIILPNVSVDFPKPILP